MTTPKKFSIRLNAFLIDENTTPFKALLADAGHGVTIYDLRASLGIDGAIYVKERAEGRPKWATQLDALHGAQIPNLTTLSASAVVFVKAKKRVVAFVFGYGRYLLDDSKFVLDFGIKTALNSLDNKTLRSVDLYSMEQEPMQKRTQAVRSSNINAFGIDVSRDILKAVTGEARSGIDWETIHGGGAQFSFTAKILGFEELNQLAEALGDLYDLSIYKTDFNWVDNIQRVQSDSLRATLDGLLVADLQNGIPSDLQLTLPEIGEWDKIAGFSYTHAKTDIKAIISTADYFAANPASGHTLEKLKSNRVFCYDVNSLETNFSVYSCLYYERVYKNKIYILFSNSWFCVDVDFLNSINTSISTVPISTLNFPSVLKYTVPVTKKNKSGFVLESEGDYNLRVSTLAKYHLLDKKLVKPRVGASSIEVCDLLSGNREFIHAKHRKGGSSGISHLFAQGRISAELLLSDKEFRKGARGKLKGVSKDLVPLDKFDPSLSEIVFLVLGDKSIDVKSNLPFFSKVNLWITYLSLTQRNFKVSIAGAPLSSSAIPMPTSLIVPKSGKIKVAPTVPISIPSPSSIAPVVISKP
ncbi:hypothetical protein DNF23_21315 [Pseudomonas syringae pv. pisi]|jgi:uncharacterized protein (TIGR04141 family)